MNWDAIGAIGEIIGAGAVAITLVYLTTQIRQNNRSLVEATASSISDSLSKLNGQLSASPELAEIFLRGREDPDSLTPIEFERFRAFCMDLMNLAVYQDGLQDVHKVVSLHYDMVQAVGSLYQTYPGFKVVADSVEEITPRDLVARFRGMEAQFQFVKASEVGTTVTTAED